MGLQEEDGGGQGSQGQHHGGGDCEDGAGAGGARARALALAAVDDGDVVLVLQARRHEDVVHVVEGDVDVGEAGRGAEGGRDGTRQVVGLEVQVLQGLDVGQVGGDVVAEVGVVDLDPLQRGESSSPRRRDAFVEEHPLDRELLQLREPR